jgi:hypothetical protein
MGVDSNVPADTALTSALTIAALPNIVIVLAFLSNCVGWQWRRSGQREEIGVRRTHQAI